VKLFFKKAWAWLKNYWYIPALLIYSVVLWMFFRKRHNNVLQMFEISKERYQKEIDTINAAHRDEIQKREKIVKIYKDTLKKLQEEYNIELEKLNKEQEKEVLNLVERHRDSPKDLAEEMKRLFGV